jgi:hypothetical protein
MASQSHKISVVDSSSSRHLSQVGSSGNPILKRCPFTWQCPVSSPTTHLNWSLFNFNKCFVLLAEGPGISPFACSSPVTDSQCFLWFLFFQSLAAFLATPIEMPQTGPGSMDGWSDPDAWCNNVTMLHYITLIVILLSYSNTNAPSSFVIFIS